MADRWARGARNTPLRGAKGSAWEGGTRVPAVMRFPGTVAAKGESPQVMTAMDVLPTLAEATGLSPRWKNALDGKSMWKNIRSGRVEAREDLYSSPSRARERTLHFAVHHSKGGEQWKLVREVGTKQPTTTTALLRIDQDATESKDVASQYPALVNELVTKLEAWRKQAHAETLRHVPVEPGKRKSPPVWVEAAEP